MRGKLQVKHSKTAMVVGFLMAGHYSYAIESADKFQGIEEITVTSQKMESTLQDTAASISVVSAESIAEAAKVSADDVLKNVTGVEVQGAARGLVFSMRGLGSDLPPGVGESSVSSNFDGVYSIRAEAGTLGFYDLDRVEVLRGPQGTLYGRNATGGVINFISKNPVLDQNSGHVSFAAGNLDFIRAEGAANIALGESSALRIAATKVSRDGYLSNGHADSKGHGVRAKYLYQPNDEISVLLGYDLVHLDGKGGGGVEDASWAAGDYYTTADPSFGDGQDYTAHKYYANIEAKVGPGRLTFIPAYQKADGTNEGFFGGRGSSGYDPKNVEQTSVELRYSNLADADIKWVIGYFHYDYEQQVEAYEMLTDGSLSDFAFSYNEGDSDAVFGQVTFPLTEALRLTVGGRYTQDERYAEGSAPPPTLIYSGDRDDSFTDWKVALEADLSEDVLFYAQAATGFRPGGVNPFNGGTIVPEDLLSYETGIKTRFMNDRAQLNASVFYYDYTDYQVVDFYIDATGPNLVFYNADAVNLGAEVEFLMAPTSADSINLSLAYLDSEIESDLCLNPYGYFGTSDASCSALGLSGLNFKGERLPHAPELSIKAGYEHRFVASAGWSVTPRLDLRYTDDQYVAPSNQEVAFQESYFSGDATVTWRSADDNLSISAFAKNFTDEEVKTGYFVGYSVVSPPRTYGVNVNYDF